MLRLCSSLLYSLLIASSASAVTMDWVPVGDAGNACDPQSQGCFGAVPYAYQISKYEVTNAQYVEFLNAVAATDTNELFEGATAITRAGDSGSYSYSTMPGRENLPINYVMFWDAIRFANWLYNGQPTGAQDTSTTEDGAYTITQAGIDNNTITRNPGATIFLPSEDEWYKAAYYDSISLDYNPFPFADGSSNIFCEVAPGMTSHSASCGRHEEPFFADVGGYTNSPSAYGTFDQGGNVEEWNETIIGGSDRGFRGGSYALGPDPLAASERQAGTPILAGTSFGFRVASIVPEPSTGLLVIAGLLRLAGRRRVRE